MDGTMIISILAAAVTAGTPLLYAALGEIITERAGVLNLGVEGMMLAGAVTGFMITVSTGNPWLGALVAILAGGAIALIHAVLCVTLQANQVVSGLALTIFGTGLSGYLGKSYIGIPAPKTFSKFAIPALSDIPLIGPVLFNQDALVYCSYLIVPIIWFYVYKTKHGLNLRAIGENPAAADAVGINVFALRYLYIIIGGMLAGLGGAYLSLAYAPAWLENMTAGRGWIAVALVIFATWNPLKAVGGAYLFGGVDALGYRMQVLGLDVSSFFLKMLPYVFTIIVLIFATTQTKKKHIGAPGALALPYDREER
jgi:ABC-type uncharacterized transport system permease subunit